MELMISGRQTLARTAWGENRSGGSIGMQSVMNVVMNRVAANTWYGKNVVAVCLMNSGGVYQFSCWSHNDPNYSKLIDPTLNDVQFHLALQLADEALSDNLPDITGGALNYYAATMNPPPPWARDKKSGRLIAGQIFL